MDVIVTGGRDYSDRNRVLDVLSLFDFNLLIQGGATGADRLSKLFAESRGIKVIEVPADWAKHGKAAGPIRNIEMLDSYPNALVIVFPGGKGTENCMNEAIKRNMLILQVKA